MSNRLALFLLYPVEKEILYELLSNFLWPLLDIILPDKELTTERLNVKVEGWM